MPGKNGRHYPSDAPDRWETFKAYNIRDVEVEQQILAKVRRLEAAKFDDELYIADQEINDRGVMIDRVLVDAAARFDDEYKAQLLAEAQELTGMENPNSPTQIKEYLRKATGLSIESLNKRIWTTWKSSLHFGRKPGKCLHYAGKWERPVTRSMQLCRNAFARTDVFTDFCSSMEQQGRGVGLAGWCRYKTCHKTTCPIWIMPVSWLSRATWKNLN